MAGEEQLRAPDRPDGLGAAATDPAAGSPQGSDAASAPTADGRVDASAATKPLADAAPGRDDRPLWHGSVFGRYELETRIGSGGMGVVYRAYDPMLERRVALKIVRPSLGGKAAQRRLFREAQALAKVRHPNVVAIHDVGVLGRDVFIAMEFVPGRTVTEWLAATQRSTVEILAVFRAAAAGLAAAHHAGLVHRDFKPSNVIVGDDRRVQVIDFGLACEADLVPEAELDDSASGVRFVPEALAGELTAAWGCAGTPAYMAPEQREGQTTTEASDQFSFCVALFVALFDVHPFGVTDGEFVTAESVATGTVDVRGRRVPAFVDRAIDRGLAPSPEQRWPSMDELADALTPRAKSRGVGLAVGGLIAALAAVVVVAVVPRAGAAKLCTGAEAELSGVWDADVRDRARAAFAATGLSYSGDTFERVGAVLDRYAGAWSAMRTAACEATHIAGTQSARLLDLRMSCLDRRRGDLAAITAVFIHEPSASTLEKALPAALALPTLDGCADAEQLTAAVPPPDDPATRRQVEGLRERLAGARALEATGQPAKALELLEPVRAEAEPLRYAPLSAEIALLGGVLHLAAGDAEAAETDLRRALVLGSRARADALVADAWVLVVQAMIDQARYDTALELRTAAEAAVARSGDGDAHRGRLMRAIGGLRYAQSDYAGAIAAHEEGLGLLRAALGHEHPEVAVSINALGSVYYLQGKHALAREHYERSLAIRERAFGPEHPTVAEATYNLAMLAYTEPDYGRCEAMFRRSLTLFSSAHGEDHPSTAAAYHGLGVLYSRTDRQYEAEVLLRRSLEIRERVLGADHPLTGSSLSTLGAALSGLERFEEARQVQQRALEIWQAKLGSEHPKIAHALDNLGECASGLGDHVEALRYHESARAIRVAAVGEDHTEVADSDLGAALALMRQGRLRESLHRVDRALAVYGKVLGEDHPDEVDALVVKAGLLLRLGSAAEARAIVERARTISERHGVGRLGVARVELELAQAVWEASGEHETARAHAERARVVLASDTRPSARKLLLRAEAWLARHPESR